MKAKVKATGEIIEVEDHGEKIHPRYWRYDEKEQGYDKEELEYLIAEEEVTIGQCFLCREGIHAKLQGKKFEHGGFQTFPYQIPPFYAMVCEECRLAILRTIGRKQ